MNFLFIFEVFICYWVVDGDCGVIDIGFVVVILVE